MVKKAKWYHTVGFLFIIVAIALLGLFMPRSQILIAWLLNLVLLALFCMLAGDYITGRFWLGWLINEQNRMSLSRLQMFLWTIVVLSAFLTAALNNLKLGNADSAVAIAIPEEIWLAMGISTVSLVGSPLILQTKREKTTNMKVAERTLMRTGVLPAPPMAGVQLAPTIIDGMIKQHSDGQLLVNEKPGDAQLTDIIRGEEVGNATTLDLTRLQNLFFTLILIGSYAASLGNLLVSSAGLIDKFPELGSSNLALLAISHAGYLVGKAIDKQPEG